MPGRGRWRRWPGRPARSRPRALRSSDSRTAKFDAPVSPPSNAMRSASRMPSTRHVVADRNSRTDRAARRRLARLGGQGAAPAADSAARPPRPVEARRDPARRRCCGRPRRSRPAVPATSGPSATARTLDQLGFLVGAGSSTARASRADGLGPLGVAARARTAPRRPGWAASPAGRSGGSRHRAGRQRPRAGRAPSAEDPHVLARCRCVWASTGRSDRRPRPRPPGSTA